MTLFTKKHNYPDLPEGDYDLVIRCSICNGEQVICMKDKVTGELSELYLITDQNDLKSFCRANNVKVNSIKKVY